MFNLKPIEIVILLLLFSGIIAGIYLTVRLARRPSPPNEGS
jgi:hypothetical protein